MKANQQLVRFIRNAAIGVMVLAVPLMARATILTTDGSFGAQTVGSAIGSDVGTAWTANNGFVTTDSAAQSPFTNVYADNGKGANWPYRGVNFGYIGQFISPIAPGSGMLYFNVDFKETIPSTYEPTTGWSFNVANGMGAHMQVRILANNTTTDGPTLTVLGGDGTQVIPLLSDGDGGSQWYNIQLAVDTTAQTFSGLLTPWDGTVSTISSRTFLSTGYNVDSVFSDNSSWVPPQMYSDNYALSDVVLMAAIPEPTTGLLLLVGAALIWRRAHRK